MDYIQKLKESFDFTLKYKSLWIFGFIIGILGGGWGGNYNSFNWEDSDNEKLHEAGENLSDFFEKPGVIIAMIIVGLIVVILSIVFWYLSSLSRAALINSVKLDSEGKTPGVKDGWNYGKIKAFSFMLLDILMFLLALVASIPLILVILVGIVFPPMFCILCFLAPIYVFLYIGLAVIDVGAQRYIVLENKSVTESISAGYVLAKNQLLEYFLGWLVSLIAGCGWAIIIFFITMILLIIFMVIGVAGVLISEILGIILILFLVLIFVLFIAVIESPYIVFTYTYWTKVVMELMEKEERS